jgi:hypothetical protein
MSKAFHCETLTWVLLGRDASACSNCQKESRAPVNGGGVWWFENAERWFWLNELSRTWIKSEKASAQEVF